MPDKLPPENDQVNNELLKKLVGETPEDKMEQIYSDQLELSKYKKINWNEYLPPGAQQKLHDGFFNSLIIDLKKALRKDRNNKALKFAIGLALAGKGKAKEAAAIICQVKDFPRLEGIKFFLFQRYETWLELIEHLLARGETLMSIELMNSLPKGYVPPKKFKKIYDKIVKKINYKVSHNKIGEGDWWYFIIAPLSTKLSIVVALGAIMLLALIFYLNIPRISNYYLELGKQEYLRGILTINHLVINRDESTLAQIPGNARKFAVEYKYPGDQKLPKNYLNNSIKMAKKALDIEPDNYQAQILMILANKMLLNFEENAQAYQQRLQVIANLKSQYKFPPFVNLKEEFEKYEKERKKILRGELKQL